MIAMVALFASPVMAQAEETPSIADFDFLVGDWEGDSIFYYPREKGRMQAHEKTKTSCVYILENTYIQCDASWTRDDGRERMLRMHLNYNKLDEGYQILYIYANWPRNVSYLMHYDETEKAFIGMSDYELSDGTRGTERVLWRPSSDGTEVYSAEFNNLETEADDIWLKSFDFTWRKVE